MRHHATPVRIRPSGEPVLQSTYTLTGIGRAPVRAAYSEYWTWGAGSVSAISGPLDAPEQLASGATTGASFTQCTGGVGPNSRAFVLSPTYCSRN
jgi:hypothetical protein